MSRRPASAKFDITAEYLLYGRLYIPNGRLDALYATRLSPTLQALVAAISSPQSRQRQYLSSTAQITEQQPDLNNINFSMQHDTGKWCTEYSWNGDDGMMGVRLLHNFGKHEIGINRPSSDEQINDKRMKRIDEEESMEGGLKGRISAGSELYFSMREKSGGSMFQSQPSTATC
jgi:distribution and morphology protein 10